MKDRFSFFVNQIKSWLNKLLDWIIKLWSQLITWLFNQTVRCWSWLLEKLIEKKIIGVVLGLAPILIEKTGFLDYFISKEKQQMLLAIIEIISTIQGLE